MNSKIIRIKRLLPYLNQFSFKEKISILLKVLFA